MNDANPGLDVQSLDDRDLAALLAQWRLKMQHANEVYRLLKHEQRRRREAQSKKYWLTEWGEVSE